MLFQAVEAVLPEAPVIRKPVGGLLERLSLQPRRACCAAPAGDEPRALQHLQVLGNRLDCDGKRCSASSLTVASPSESRARIDRRVGSARAANVIVS